MEDCGEGAASKSPIKINNSNLKVTAKEFVPSKLGNGNPSEAGQMKKPNSVENLENAGNSRAVKNTFYDRQNNNPKNSRNNGYYGTRNVKKRENFQNSRTGRYSNSVDQLENNQRNQNYQNNMAENERKYTGAVKKRFPSNSNSNQNSSPTRGSNRLNYNSSSSGSSRRETENYYDRNYQQTRSQKSNNFRNQYENSRNWRSSECMICCEFIRNTQSIWNCSNCYHILHLNCIAKWAKSSKSDEGWRCVACQEIKKAIPRDYLCFCGKAKNPQFNHADLSHSCGEVCRKTENCEHPCSLLCHPGKCPTECQSFVVRETFLS